jgi:hypothetical protein
MIMVKYMKVSLTMIIRMVLDIKYTPIMRNTKDSLKMVVNAGKADSNGQMERHMMDNG